MDTQTAPKEEALMRYLLKTLEKYQQKEQERDLLDSPDQVKEKSDGK